MEDMFKKNIWHAMNTARDLIELEAIEQRMNVLWGVELDIQVKPAKKQEGRFFGKNVIAAIEKDYPQK